MYSAIIAIFAFWAFILGSGTPDLQQGQQVWHLEGGEEVTIPAHASLSRIEQVVVDSRGSLFLLDALSKAISVVRPDGSYRTIGRAGNGPGEFVRPWRIGIRDSLLWVVDAGNSRLSTFDLQGQFVRSLPFASYLARHGPGAVLSVWDDSTVIAATDPDLDGLWELAIVDHELERQEVVDTLDLSSQNIEVDLGTRKGGVLRIRNPFSFSDLLALSYLEGRAMVIHRVEPVDGAEPMIAVTAISEAGSRTVSAGYDQEVLPRDEYEAWVEELGAPEELAQAGLVPSARGLRNRILERFEPPRFRSPVRNGGRGIIDRWVLIDDMGRLWLRRPDSTWQVWGESGPIAEVKTKEAAPLLAVAGHFAWGVSYDRDGLPHVMVYDVIHD